MPKQELSNEQKLGLYAKLVATNPKAQLKGATMRYTSLNGHMYSYFTKDGYLALRLPEKEREVFLKKYKTELVTAYGIIQKEYVRVPESLLKKTSELKTFFNISFEYIGSLKPKATTKKKKGLSRIRLLIYGRKRMLLLYEALSNSLVHS